MGDFRTQKSGFAQIWSLLWARLPSGWALQGSLLLESCQAALLQCCENWIAFTDCLDFHKLTFTYGKCPVGRFSAYSINIERESINWKNRKCFNCVLSESFVQAFGFLTALLHRFPCDTHNGSRKSGPLTFMGCCENICKWLGIGEGELI